MEYLACAESLRRAGLSAAVETLIVHKLSYLGYFIYENLYKLNKVIAWLEFSFPYPLCTVMCKWYIKL